MGLQWEVIEESDEVFVDPNGYICHYKRIATAPKREGPRLLVLGLAYAASVVALAYAAFWVMR